jgi:F-type H+-transporting ATPase subunit delta
MDNIKVAKRYAKAVMEIAKSQNCVEVLIEDLANVVALIKSSNDLRLIIHSPIIRHSKKLIIFDEIFKGKLSELTYFFIRLLIIKGRSDLLKTIAHCFQDLYDVDNGIVNCKIISAKELDEDSKNKALKFVEDTTKMKVCSEFQIEPDVIGGIMIMIEDLVYDATIQNKLKELHHSLIS